MKPRFGMELHQTVLDNGLSVYYLPNPTFSKTFALLAVNFGSVDERFTLDGIPRELPAGVAHFLEHKMFEDADGNALQKYAVTGASPNAFTSHTMTAYHFSCTDGFAENLEILLRFVFTPYFTDANVQKEKGIIGQEIGMLDDTPDWVAYMGVFEGLYHEHPVHTSIAGSVDSISGITPSLLFDCHRAFYHPSNACLVVCGTADWDELVRMAAVLTPSDAAAPVVERQYGTRQNTVAHSVIAHRMAVSQPTFQLGFKDKPLEAGESRLRRQLVGDLAARILCGRTSPLFTELYEQGLVTRRFDSSYTLLPQGACAVCGGDSADPQTVRTRLEQAVQTYAAEGVPEELFTRMKKACYGLNVRVLDEPDDLCRSQVEAAFAGECYLDFAQVFETITAEDVQQMFVRWAQPDCTTLSVVWPRTENE